MSSSNNQGKDKADTKSTPFDQEHIDKLKEWIKTYRSSDQNTGVTAELLSILSQIGETVAGYQNATLKRDQKTLTAYNDLCHVLSLGKDGLQALVSPPQVEVADGSGVAFVINEVDAQEVERRIKALEVLLDQDASET